VGREVEARKEDAEPEESWRRKRARCSRLSEDSGAEMEGRELSVEGWAREL